ncbi:UDP-GlcNAc--UDP-phosphate GlcNAc-1-phosphate transferase [Maribacter polysaccharolyticus]|uniref:UDP-GlcNAc--UDP-phosphate GlcNAc-1-phosphate transferase n=1 Tax=Maribacter polysaccharolyticus TaxID=3020831 RepID=UPI00237F619F|nr:UDP-GlcNAc--UDP-phosphate GlcNAc-1-phosphate transferase [Maribacter polysaccharolyticus]MDE3743517.1 UDP-GlcNAc--UDP-phosphate GlcNAc-1-phosphate transferase [Maribacter polysaccharolyticus]
MSPLLIYIITTIALFIFAYAYISVAKKWGIIDVPNERSSHSLKTIRGGGVIFVLALIIYFITHSFSYPFLAIAIAILAIISFIDDIKSLGTGIRLIFQFLGINLIFYQLNLFQLPFWYLIPIFIFCLGMLNIFNFMDGINGITGFYTLVTIGTLIYINHLSLFIDNDLLIYAFIGVAVFGFFNFRKKAIFFAGDIGSITIGVFLLFLLLYFSFQLNTFVPLLFISVYFVDGGVTILERLLRKENIFKPHKSHLYQKLTQKTKLTHLQVAAVYASIQFCVNFITIFLIFEEVINPYLLSLLLLLSLTLVNIIVKRKLKN